MGCSKKRIDPRILNYVNRNFYSCFTKTVIKAVKQLPSPWEPCRLGRKGHAPGEVAVACILKVGFNQTYDSIEAFLKESETFKNSFKSIPGHSVTHRGMKKTLYTIYKKSYEQSYKISQKTRYEHSSRQQRFQHH